MIDTVIYKTFILARTADVFEALTTGEGWMRWLTQNADIDLRPGGKMILKWRGFGPDFNTFEDKGEVIEVERNKKFVFRWTPVGIKNPTQVTIKLFSEHGGTIVRVKDEGYPVNTPEDQRIMMECACGWGEALTLLKFHLEYGLSYTHPNKEDHNEITGTYANDDIN